jgi:hypothetical protein
LLPSPYDGKETDEKEVEGETTVEGEAVAERKEVVGGAR